MKLITVKKLKKSYSDRELLDIDKFEMEDGEKIGIVGENGVGKSTFLKIILGEVQADEGSINLTDRDGAYTGQRYIIGFNRKEIEKIVGYIKGIINL